MAAKGGKAKESKGRTHFGNNDKVKKENGMQAVLLVPRSTYLFPFFLYEEKKAAPTLRRVFAF